MKYILCYGDSNTYGTSPDDAPRYNFPVRWPGVLQRELGDAVHVYENGLGGRTTTFTDDVEPGRNGREAFAPVLEVNRPLDLVIIMLGTNDCKIRFANYPARDVAEGLRLLIKLASNERYARPGQPRPEILIVAPPPLRTEWDESVTDRIFDKASAKKIGSPR